MYGMHVWHRARAPSEARRERDNFFSSGHRACNAKPVYRSMQAITQILIVSILSYASVMQNHEWRVWHRNFFSAGHRAGSAKPAYRTMRANNASTYS